MNNQKLMLLCCTLFLAQSLTLNAILMPRRDAHNKEAVAQALAAKLPPIKSEAEYQQRVKQLTQPTACSLPALLPNLPSVLRVLVALYAQEPVYTIKSTGLGNPPSRYRIPGERRTGFIKMPRLFTQDNKYPHICLTLDKSFTPFDQCHIMSGFEDPNDLCILTTDPTIIATTNIGRLTAYFHIDTVAPLEAKIDPNDPLTRALLKEPTQRDQRR
jgi:hypothetical protein